MIDICKKKENTGLQKIWSMVIILSLPSYILLVLHRYWQFNIFSQTMYIFKSILACSTSASSYVDHIGIGQDSFLEITSIPRIFFLRYCFTHWQTWDWLSSQWSFPWDLTRFSVQRAISHKNVWIHGDHLCIVSVSWHTACDDIRFPRSASCTPLFLDYALWIFFKKYRVYITYFYYSD
jgi:hypothetical protein